MSTIELIAPDHPLKNEPEKFYQAMKRGTGKFLEKTTQYALKELPQRTGRAAGKKGGPPSITWQMIESGKYIIGRINATARSKEGYNYLYGVHEGTGLFGKAKRYILPKRKKVLCWIKDPSIKRPSTAQGWKELRMRGLVVYARYSRGQRKNPFLARAWKRSQPEAKAIYDAEMRKFL
jgi:hypothetical protein